MLPDKLSDAVIDFVPKLVAGDGAKFLSGNLNPEIKRWLVADIDDDRIRASVASEKVRDSLDRFLRSGKTNASRARRPGLCSCNKNVQPLQRQCQMRAALVIRDRMDFVDNHSFHIRENAPASLRRQQNVERLRSCYQDVRRTLEHFLPLAHQSVT